MLKHGRPTYGLAWLALLAWLVGCAAPTATPLPFSKEQAISRATQEAKQSVPEVGIQQARIDSVTAELITLGEADSRLGGGRGPGGYSPGQTAQSPVWWVVVHGYFRYQGLGAPPNPNALCEADERDFVYDGRTGDAVGGFMPGTRCAVLQTPSTSLAPLSTTPAATVPLALAPTGQVSDQGWTAWTESVDAIAQAPQRAQRIFIQAPNGKITEWRVSDDARQTYYLPLEWLPGTRWILLARGASCSSCWSWGLPLAKLDADTGQITDLGVAALVSREARASNPKQPGILAIAAGGSRYLLDGMQLVVLDLTTGAKRELTDSNLTAFEPAWSPDGKLLAYAAVAAKPGAVGDGRTLDRFLNGRAIYLVDPTTRETRLVTHPGDEAMDGWPHWTEDGNSLIYARRYADRTEIRSIALDSQMDQLVDTRGVSPMCDYAGCGWENVLGSPSPTRVPTPTTSSFLLTPTPPATPFPLPPVATPTPIALCPPPVPTHTAAPTSPMHPAAAGRLDPTFGNGGMVLTFKGSGAIATIIQPDSKIITVGSISLTSHMPSGFALQRFNADGSPDCTFGNNGTVVANPFDPNRELLALAAALQPDGKVVVAGTIVNEHGFDDFALVRFNQDGSLDRSFGNSGKVSTDIDNGNDWIQAIAIQPDGNIVVAGKTMDKERTTSVLALARYRNDGSLDYSFGQGGQVTVDLNQHGEAHAIVIQSDGKIVVTGTGYSVTRMFNFALLRFNPEGTLDDTFGKGGIVLTALGDSSAGANALTIQPDGKLVAAGQLMVFGRAVLAVRRYNSDGSLDPGFMNAERGLNLDYASAATSAAIQRDGKIVVTANTFPPDANIRSMVVRYNSDGSLDSSFGSGGLVMTRTGKGDNLRAVAIQVDGKILAAGTTTGTPTCPQAECLWPPGLVLFRYVP